MRTGLLWRGGSLLVLLMVAMMGVPQSPTALAQTAGVQYERPRELSVSGTAERWVDPDRCRIFLGCQSREKQLQVARRENNARVQRVLEAIRRLKIKGLKMKAPSLEVNILYASSRRATELPEELGYEVTQQFTVLLTEGTPEKLSFDAGRVIDAALGAGANMLGQVVFFRDDQKEIERQLLAEAVKDAMTRARIMAQAAGVKISGVWSLSSEPVYRQFDRYAQNVQTVGPAAPGGGTTIVSGRLQVTCSVRLTAEIAGK
ncbi:MAG: SIMPL domain-containing protein [Armatimonadetes bacterium]|nr:SIMPL domain-containing protein [Armatimonadota bacterium]